MLPPGVKDERTLAAYTLGRFWGLNILIREEAIKPELYVTEALFVEKEFSAALNELRRLEAEKKKSRLKTGG